MGWKGTGVGYLQNPHPLCGAVATADSGGSRYFISSSVLQTILFSEYAYKHVHPFLPAKTGGHPLTGGETEAGRS